MKHADPTRQRPRLTSVLRKTSPIGLMIFAIAYIGVLVITFAPEGSWAIRSGVSQTSE